MRGIINNLKTFENNDDCQKYIERISKEDRLVIIISGQFSKEIIPRIHHFNQVSSIYIYYLDKQIDQQSNIYFFFSFLLDMYDFVWGEAFLNKVEQFLHRLVLLPTAV